MKKNIREFKKGNLILLGQSGWVVVVGDAFVENDLVRLRAHLLGLMYSQLLVFHKSESFEYKEG